MKPHEYVILEIARERERQIITEGRTPEHDDTHSRGEMALAAAAYAYNAGESEITRKWNVGRPVVVWPWSAEWWKPTTRRLDLIKAGALIVAEIERLDRAGDAS